MIPLAPSAAAADVLRDELGCRTENLHKFHHTHTSAPLGGQRPIDEWFQLQPGDLVLVDEAGMAGTRHLDWLTAYARDRGALVRLLGDPAQLSSVEAGGALRLLADDTDAVELTDLHRFHDPDEGKATLAIRDGRTEGIEFYDTHDRISSGARHELLDQAFAAWDADQSAGLDTLLIAASTADVVALNTRARAARVRAGTVDDAGSRAGGRNRRRRRRPRRHPTQRPPAHHARRVASSRTATPGPSTDGTATATSPWSAPTTPRSACLTTTSRNTSSSATPPPQHAPKAAPSTPHTPSSTAATPAKPSTSR